MPSNDERREVARRLRSLEVPARVKKKEHPEKTAMWYELICGSVGGKKDPWFGVKALADRLADLIEPGELTCRMYRDDHGLWHCSNCYDVKRGIIPWANLRAPEFCPNCGARVVHDA